MITLPSGVFGGRVCSWLHKVHSISSSMKDQNGVGYLSFQWRRDRPVMLGIWVEDEEELLTDELGALIQDFPIIFFELESNEKVVQAKSYALEVSLWFPNGADFIVNIFETQGFTKSLDY